MKEIRVAIIGYGGIARMHNAAYHELAFDGVQTEDWIINW